MIRLTLASSLLALLAACGDGQPLFDENGTDPTDTTDTTDTTEGDGGDIDTDGATPPLPGTDAPSPRRPTPAFFATKTATAMAAVW